MSFQGDVRDCGRWKFLPNYPANIYIAFFNSSYILIGQGAYFNSKCWHGK